MITKALPAKMPTESVKVEFMPGRVAEMPAHLLQAPPKYVICKLVRQANGMPAMVPMQWSPMVRMTRRLLDDLGLPCSYQTLYKLVKAGFVGASMPSPGVLMIDLASLIEHFNATRVNPEGPIFWTARKIAEFREAAGALTDKMDERARPVNADGA
jgi:hypothetical protein